MEGIIFTGIQATGKSTFYKENFFNTHVRISLDLLNTRNKENVLLNTCLDLQQKLVIDNTNVTKLERLKYIDLFKKHKYKIIGYYFESKISHAIERNSKRKDKILEVGILSKHKALEIPNYREGFYKLFYVKILNNKFIIEEWKDEV